MALMGHPAHSSPTACPQIHFQGLMLERAFPTRSCCGRGRTPTPWKSPARSLAAGGAARGRGGGTGDSHCGGWLAPWEGKRLCPEFFGSRESARAGMGAGKLVQHKHMTIPAGNPLAVPNPSAEQGQPGRLPGPPTLPGGNRKTSRQQQPWELEELSSGNNDPGREQGYSRSLTAALTMLRMRWIRAGNGTDPPALPWLALLSPLPLHLSSQWDSSLVLLSLPSV